MRCRKKGCGGDLRIRQVYEVGDHGRTQTAQCARCRTRVTVVQFVVYEDPERGEGAYAVAKRWASGEPPAAAEGVR